MPKFIFTEEKIFLTFLSVNLLWSRTYSKNLAENRDETINSLYIYLKRNHNTQFKSNSQKA